MLVGKIDRKIVKQTVMTSVYGVTFIGARKQILNAMRSRVHSVTEDDIYQASGYVARHTFSSLEEMFTPARKIMSWLGECARRIAKSGKPVEWITPLGLPVVQVSSIFLFLFLFIIIIFSLIVVLAVLQL
jgi:DNA-directed RNA polymerase